MRVRGCAPLIGPILGRKGCPMPPGFQRWFSLSRLMVSSVRNLIHPVLFNIILSYEIIRLIAERYV